MPLPAPTLIFQSLLTNVLERLRNFLHEMSIKCHSRKVYACCFVNNTVTYFNLFVCPSKLRNRVPNFYSLILIFSTLCVVHDLIFQRKLSRRRLPITFVYFVSHASAQALRPITFTQRFRTTRHLFSIQLL